MTGGLISTAEDLARRGASQEGCGAGDCPTPYDGGHDHPPGRGSTVLLDFTDPASRTMRTVRAEQAARTR